MAVRGSGEWRTSRVSTTLFSWRRGVAFATPATGRHGVAAHARHRDRHHRGQRTIARKAEGEERREGSGRDRLRVQAGARKVAQQRTQPFPAEELGGFSAPHHRSHPISPSIVTPTQYRTPPPAPHTY